jgi:hypothetical protein
MIKRLGLLAMNSHTPYAHWAALDSFLQQQDFFAHLRAHVPLDCKAIIHTPHKKLLDVVVSMLADCSSLKQINTRLRPDTALAAEWGREWFADRSTLSRVLEAFTPLALVQWRIAVEQLYQREGQALHHPFAHDPCSWTST